MEQTTIANRSAPGSLINVAIQTIVLALIVNLLIFFVTNAIADGNIIDPNTGHEMPFVAVIVATIAWSLVTIGVYWLFVRRLQRPATVFQIIAVVVLLLSFLPILLNGDLNGTTKVALIIMHLATFASLITSLAGLNLLRR